MASDQAEELASAIADAFDAYRRLVRAAKDLPSRELPGLRGLVDPDLLVELVNNRILPGKMFEVLLAIAPERATGVLFSGFLGEIDPDRCCGGLTYDLASMLRHMKDATGEEGIRGILNHSLFNQRMLGDERFVQAVADALDIDESDAASWIRQNGPSPKK